MKKIILYLGLALLFPSAAFIHLSDTHSNLQRNRGSSGVRQKGNVMSIKI